MSLATLPRSSSLATSFAQNRVLHPGFDWSEALDTFLPQKNAEELMQEVTEAWISTKDQRTVLSREVRQLQVEMSRTTGGRQKPGANVDLEKCSTDDVLLAIQNAMEHGRSRKRSSAHSFICTIGKHRDVLKQWLSLLPQGDYGSGVCGAFTILLDASAQIYSVDNYVYECLSSIPAALQKASVYMEIYREQKSFDLIKKSVDLYQSVLVALTECVKYSQKNTSVRAQAKRFVSSMVKGDHFKQCLKDAINDVAEKVAAVEEQAKMCQHKRLGGVYDLLYAKERQQRTDSIDTIGARDRQYISFLNYLKDLFDSHGSLDRKGQLREFSEEVPENPPKGRKKIKAVTVVPPDSEPEEAYSILPQDLLNLIAYNSFVTAQDLAEALNITFEPDSTGLCQLSQAAKSDALRNFLETLSISSALAIHASCEEPSTLSPLSLLDGQIARILFTTREPILLIYFCSLHSESWDVRSSAIGLVTSLVGQLLSCPGLTFDLSFIDNEMETILEEGEFLALVQLFLSLLHQLPSEDRIFCIIDEVSVYETPERRKDMRMLLATLVKHVIEKQEDENLPVFKLLLTDGVSSGFNDIVGMENTLDLGVDGDEEDEDFRDAVDVVGRVLKGL